MSSDDGLRHHLSSEQRAPFDEKDHALVERFCAHRGLLLIDPLECEASPSDPYFAPSLASARYFMANAFGRRRKDGTLFRAYPAFIERPYTNAFARDLGGLELCAIDTGLATTTFEISCFAFSQAAFCPEVGDAAQEASPELPSGNLLGYSIADRVFEAVGRSQPEGIGEELIPLDPERRLTAHFLSQLMMRFVWFHELFHGLNGHTGYFRSRSEGLTLCEVEGDPALSLVETETGEQAQQTRAMRQALEFDADRSAFSTMYKLQLAGDEPFEVLAGQQLRVRVKLTMLAGLLMTFLFDQAAKRYQLSRGHSHPTGTLRLHNVIATIASEGLDLGETRDLLGTAFLEIDRLRPKVAGIFTPREVINDLHLPRTAAYLSDLERTLNRLRGSLTEFRYA